MFLTDKKVSRVLVCSSILLFAKMDQRNCIKFCEKNDIKCARTFKMLTVARGKFTMSRTQVQLWYNQFTEVDVGISFTRYQAIFTDVLGMKRVAAKIVPKLLTFEQ